MTAATQGYAWLTATRRRWTMGAHNCSREVLVTAAAAPKLLREAHDHARRCAWLPAATPMKPEELGSGAWWVEAARSATADWEEMTGKFMRGAEEGHARGMSRQGVQR